MLIIISPAKKLNINYSFDKNNISYPEFHEEACELINILKSKSKQDLISLMKISDKIADLNIQRNTNFELTLNNSNSYPAAKLFNGEVYSGLDFTTMNNTEVSYAQKHLRILSGLYGILKPLDLIQPYRLEMGSKLANAKGPNLYQFWQSIITDKINSELKKHKAPYLINLASNEYSKVINSKNLNNKVITINFKDVVNGHLKTIMIYAKMARGLMAKTIIINKIDNIELLKDLVINNYSYSQKHSNSDSELVFIRTHE
ncbi:MAG: peroxide stress protein YaaA [Rickettsiales bacterium]|jgi:uncharacterized protein|nr:peroxide stress protein YaaA [Rickettsiales bacterium]